jgi:hypothetical protein
MLHCLSHNKIKQFSILGALFSFCAFSGEASDLPSPTEPVKLWQPVPPRGEITKESDFFISLGKENIKDLYERYKKNSTRLQKIEQVAIKAQNTLVVESAPNQELLLNYKLKIDPINLRFETGAEIKDVGFKFLSEIGAGTRVEAVFNGAVLYYKFNNQTTHFGYQINW